MVKKPDQLGSELKAFINLLTGSFKVFAVYLYGSYAWGKADENSDIDIAVFIDKFSEDPFEDMKLMFKLRRKIDTSIEPLPFKKEDYFSHNDADFISDILARGRLLYKDGQLFI